MRRFSALLVPLLIATSLGVTPAGAQTPGQCTPGDPGSDEEAGPTDITAVSGNQRLSVGMNGDATVTVFKWPSPSFYDQIKYRTSDRSERRYGALPNEGSFLGLAWRNGGAGSALQNWTFRWLRDLPSRQRFATNDGDEIFTTFTKKNVGLTVTVRDVVAHRRDALVRVVKVRRSIDSPVRSARVIAFANFNPVVSKTIGSPTADWCTEEQNDAGAQYVAGNDAIVHSMSGADQSTTNPSSVALTMGFLSHPEGHQVGADTYAGNNAGVSAYDDASDGKLSGVATGTTQVDEALADDLSLASRRSDSTTLVLAGAADPDAAAAVLKHVRNQGAAAIRAKKKAWWHEWLRGAALPHDAPPKVAALAKRALISIRQTSDPGGLVVTSIATQPPMGLDWVRHGSYINEALEAAGHPEMVRAHDLRYALLQAQISHNPPGSEATPPGNWVQNYYADGVAGGTIPYEIDETGLGIWTLWHHYALTGNKFYLLQAHGGAVYEAIQRAAHYLTEDAPVGCRSPSTHLQCLANEEDDPNPSQTLKGAQAAWLGLKAAVKAAKVRGTPTALDNAAKWAHRRDELAKAIKKNLFEEGCNCYTHDYETGGTFLWPVGFAPKDSPAADGQARANWRHIARAVSGTDRDGRYESRAILGNAFAWKGDRAKNRKLRRALEWVARVPTTDATGLLGAAWAGFPKPRNRIQTMGSQPNVWNQAMFYLAALKVYGRTRWGG